MTEVNFHGQPGGQRKQEALRDGRIFRPGVLGG